MNPYLNENTTITEAVSDQELGKQARMRQIAEQGYTKGIQDNKLASQAAYEQGLADQARKLAELRQFEGMQAMTPEQLAEQEYYRRLDSLPGGFQDPMPDQGLGDHYGR